MNTSDQPLREAVISLSQYLMAEHGDPFRVRAVASALTRAVAENDSIRMQATADYVNGSARDLVAAEWQDHLRSTPWYRRRRESSREAGWRERRFKEREQAAAADVEAFLFWVGHSQGRSVPEPGNGGTA